MRLDAYLVETGLIRSRERAKAAIRAGLVTVNGAPASKPGQSLNPDDKIVCDGDTHDYVSRGALKLERGLDAFGVDPARSICLDLGASTGGFTEVLLRRGARRVYAVDVGHGQLDESIAADPRVINLERTHAKALSSALVPEPIELVVCDVSFISIMKALPFALSLCSDGAKLVTLVKPQFELGPDHLGKGGLVTMPLEDQHRRMLETIVPWLSEQGWRVLGTTDSPIQGGDGNHEFLVGAIYDGP
ncbi:TlyA family RNA methyltransferase [Parvularcula sp. LCG005]|uniref:TlyA family RNA methyltransferase n=1 Tax=Parvularcula sp. LCG005 TaxID=3078805 RepID=UPI002943DCDE|nr:TlyA family RNA methyltransferase [Parvularcula sp. LCG005]WOI54643.1 TlyA family RNA methyltransferase [Parvularcula sp. LCG005]